MDNLPKSAESHDKERRSKLAFDLIVPDHLFLVRDEAGGDYGVDKILELKLVGTHMSNFRSHIQLKCTSKTRSANGSITFSVPIKTLSYLLNQPNSLFVVYIESENIFMWEWIIEIAQYATAQNIDITTTNNQTLNYHFIRELRLSDFTEIHKQINHSGVLVKQISEYIKISNASEKISLNIISESVTDVKNIVADIKKYGIAFSNSGEYNLLYEMISRVPNIFKSEDPDYCVVVAYLKYCNGEYYDAMSWIPKGRRFNVVSENLMEVSEYIELTLKLLLGICSPDIYSVQFDRLCLKYPKSLITLQHRFFEYKDRLVEADHTLKNEFRLLQKEFENIVLTIRNHESTNSILLINLEINEWEITGFLLLRELNFARFNMDGRDKIGHPLSLSERVDSANEFIKRNIEWLMRFEFLYKTVADDIIKARLYTSYANLQMQFISSARMSNKDSTDNGNEMLKTIVNSLLYNIEILRSNGYLHELLRAYMSLAECYQGLGLPDEAIGIVNDVMENADSIGLVKVVSYCKAFLDGIFIFNFEKLINDSMKDNIFLSDLSDKELNKYARQMLELLGLSDDRLPNLLIEYFWLRDDEVSGLNFCRHLHTHQDLEHTLSLETMYLINPNRKFVCRKFGYQSSMGHDRKILSRRFKSSFCLACEYKETLHNGID
ncbi:hypothetical protein SY83_06140 [Paenibacillus swuensis]|uniref:DUF4365 domain-containing protein n=1 Tax=Paenibacillus swuensis TaxID=1178515 RepID=A0A172TG03_9BACL|nr:DUF4365 domain-containing protein [Paenibacillus swuensis]ANE45940.1 hypothetical protein SY83_06140 [Paenibacillus swuensis]